MNRRKTQRELPDSSSGNSSEPMRGASGDPVTILPARAGAEPIDEQEESQIRELAYRLYEERGRVDGYAEKDWFEAEAIIRKRGKLAA